MARRRRNPKTPTQLYDAFHGHAPIEALAVEGVHWPAEAVILGEVEEIVYRAPAHSGRYEDGALWVHQFGDYGGLRGVGPDRPILAYDPAQPGVLLLISLDGEEFFVDERGIVG